MKRLPFVLVLVTALLVLSAVACSRGGSNKVIYVTATPLLDAQGTPILFPTMTSDAPTNTPIQPTPNPTRPVPNASSSGVYVVQPGDTLGTVAALYGITIEDLINANSLPNPDTLEVGQTINVPGTTLVYGPDNKLIPDSELVYSPTASGFNVASFIKFQQGFLKAYSEDVDGEVWSGVEIIDFVAQNYSVNPRLLLALLEYRGHWITELSPSEQATSYSMGLANDNRTGLLKQMLDAANALNYGYYGWKYRGTLSTTFGDGTRIFYASTLNPGTVGVQYMLSVTNTVTQWQQDTHPDGFFQTYLTLFGDPFATAREPITPPDLIQPSLALPFAPGEEWVYTGGPHGAYNSGSAWGAIDFGPPEPPDDLVNAQGSCYISPNWVTAVASGIIARSGEGYVIVDLDGDGDEHTGWTIVYLHIDSHERVASGSLVQTGDPLGHPSCEGGVSTGTHLHIGRRYNGEWIPVSCEDCAPGITVPPFVLGEWTVFGFENQEYQGYMVRSGEDGYRQADMSRDYTGNRIIW